MLFPFRVQASGDRTLGPGPSRAASPDTRVSGLASQLATTGNAIVRGSDRQLPAVLRRAELQLTAKAAPPFAKRALRVPSDAFVPVGIPALPSPPAPLLLPSGESLSTANDNAAPTTNRERVGRTAREALFLVILFVTIAAAFYGGRQNGFRNVIVVPGPIGFNSEVT